MADGLKVIADRLVRTRLALGFDEQQEFCSEIEVAKNVYNPFERGRRRISIDVALKIKQRFGITTDWIYAGDPKGLPAEVYSRIRRQAA